jgi:spore coat polysaccharide biosynthesis predicted glycosyltransferase SpsG
MTVPVLVRADGSTVLGMGNITRSLSIAEVFRARGSDIVFAARDLDARVKVHVEAMGCKYLPLPTSMTLAEDITVTRSTATSIGAQHVIVDLANPEATRDLASYSDYLQGIAEPFRLIIVDDLTRAVFPSSVVVNPNVEVTRDEYNLRFDPTILFGPQFAILRSAYRDAAREKSYTDHPVKDIVISLGGGVIASELLMTILDAIHLAFGGALHVELVTGMGDAQRLRPALARFESVATPTNVPSLRDVLTRCDVAFVSGGVTKFEAAATGTPMVIVPSIDHQELWGASFARTGVGIYAGAVGEVRASTLAASCNVLQDATTRRRMGRRGAELVDGRGAERIVDTALSL